MPDIDESTQIGADGRRYPIGAVPAFTEDQLDEMRQERIAQILGIEFTGGAAAGAGAGLVEDGTDVSVFSTDLVVTADSVELPSPLPIEKIGTGSRTGVRFLRDDGAWADVAGGGGGASLPIPYLALPRVDDRLSPALIPSDIDGPVRGSDALADKAITAVEQFAAWCAAHGVNGFIGEIGWPQDVQTELWNAVGEAFYEAADTAGLPVTWWDVNERKTGAVRLRAYDCAEDEVFGGTIVRANPPAQVIEAHTRSVPGVLRGVNYSLGAHGQGPFNVLTQSNFSNSRDSVEFQVGDAINTHSVYNYGSPETYQYLASRGHRVIRLNFRWERIQRVLGGELDAIEIARLDDAIGWISDAGMVAILAASNFGSYYLDDGTQGVRRDMGSAQLTQAHFVDLWDRLSARYMNNPAVYGYDLMNEPANPTLSVWTAASQAAVTAVRANGDTKLILVSGHGYAKIEEFDTVHPSGGWVTDSADNLAYTGHYYLEPSGGYPDPYATYLAAAVAEGYTNITPPPTGGPGEITTASIDAGPAKTVRVNLGAGFSQAHGGAPTAVSWTNEDYDTDGWWDLAAPTRITPGEVGFYTVIARLVFESNATADRMVVVRRFDADGSNMVAFASPRPNASGVSGATTEVIAPAQVQITAVGQYIEIYAYQGSGVALTVTGAVTVTTAQGETTGAFSGAFVRLASDTAVGSGETPIALATEVFDVGGYHNPAQPTRLTVPVDGFYMVGATAQAAVDTNSRFLAFLKVNGTTYVPGARVDLPPGSGATDFPGGGFARPIELSAGDYVELAYSGAATTLHSDTALWIYQLNGVGGGGGGPAYTAGEGIDLTGDEISLVTPVAPANLGTGTRTGAKFLRDDGVWAAVPSGSTAVDLPYSGAPGGTGGLINDLGTRAGAFANPAAGGAPLLGSVASSADPANPVTNLTDRNGATFWYDQAAVIGDWVTFDLGATRTMQVTSYDMREIPANGTATNPRSWVLEGSTDGSAWTPLRTHTDDTTFQGNSAGRWGHFAVTGAAAYRYLRLRNTGVSWAGNNYFQFAEVEFYGTLTEPGGGGAYVAGNGIDITADVVSVDYDTIASGTRDGTKFLRDDSTWATPAGGGSSVIAQKNMVKTTSQSVSALTATALQFTAGTAGYWSSGAPSRFTVPVGEGGLWFCEARIPLTAWPSAAGSLGVIIRLNGSNNGLVNAQFFSNAGAVNPPPIPNVTGVLLLVAGDYLEVLIESSVAVTVSAGFYTNGLLKMTRLT